MALIIYGSSEGVPQWFSLTKGIGQPLGHSELRSAGLIKETGGKVEVEKHLAQGDADVSEHAHSSREESL